MFVALFYLVNTPSLVRIGQQRYANTPLEQGERKGWHMQLKGEHMQLH